MTSNTPPQAALLLSEAEAARTLGISPRTLFTMRKDGRIPFVRLGHRVLYNPRSLRAWLEAQEQGGPDAS
jgi:excisionase family DNA binding protein